MRLQQGLLDAAQVARLQRHVAALVTSRVKACGRPGPADRLLVLTLHGHGDPVPTVRYTPSCAIAIGGPLRDVAIALRMLEMGRGDEVR